jgi:hypothetical protein
MLSFAAQLEGAWDCTPAEPCLANRRAVKNLVLFSCSDNGQKKQKGMDLQSPFALDVLPFHESISRFVQIDQSGLTWGVLVHRKAKLDGRNLEAYLKSYEGEQALTALLEPLSGALAAVDVEEPQIEADAAAQVIPHNPGKGWCIWWRAQEVHADLITSIAQDLERLEALVHTLQWRNDNDLCGANEEQRHARAQESQSRFRQGDRVRITAGLFAGRIGRVEQRHDNGSISLGIGPMTIQVADDEVSPL